MTLTQIRPLAAAALALSLCSLNAATTRAWSASTPAEDGIYRFSSPASNWLTYNAVPASSLTDYYVRVFGNGRDVVHDLGDKFKVYQLQFTQGNNVKSLSGDSFVLGSGGISVSGSGGALVIANDLLAGTNATIGINVAASNTLECTGAMSYDASDETLTNFVWALTAAGDIVFKGSWEQTGLPMTRHRFRGGGTVYLDGRVCLPNIDVFEGVRIVIRDGGSLETWGSTSGVYSFLQKSTIDVQDGGRLLLRGMTCYAQEGAGVTNTINVASGGLFDMRSDGARVANNGVTLISANGGAVYWHVSGDCPLAENGRTVVRVGDGGQLVALTKAGALSEFVAAVTSSRATPPFPEGSEVRVESGGAFVATRIRNSPNADAFLDVPVRFVLDGGTMVSPKNSDVFAFSNKATAERNQLRVHVRGGGAVFDACSAVGTHNWNAVAIQGTDEEGGADGVFEKRGPGLFRLSAPYRSTGTFRVRAGSLAIADAANFSGRPLELRPRAKVSFSGATLSLSALAAKDGVVCLASGQSLSVASAPAVEGALVFDVATGTDGAFTLMTGTGIDDALAAKCRVLSPTAGKSASFAAVDGALVLTVADGTAPDAPALAASEDARTVLSGGASFTYSGDGATLDASSLCVYGNEASTFAIAEGAGDVTFSGAPDLLAASPSAAPVVRLSAPLSGPGGFVFTGDWKSSYLWTPPWFGFAFGEGTYSFDSGFSFDGALSMDLASGETLSISAPAFGMTATTDATGATRQRPGAATIVALDGGVVKAAEGGAGSLGDFFAGATALALGANGAAFDTQGLDVTVTQTLLANPAGASAAAGFEKRGAGTLALGAGMNVVYGPLKVMGGTLRAGFETGMRKAYPAGALAIWDFDGDDPYADKSGHGHRLAQSHPDQKQVGFTEENAYLGTAAVFSNSGCADKAGGSLCSADIEATTSLRQTISARVRLASHNVNSGIVSTRSKSDFSSSPGSFDLAYKKVWDVEGGRTGFATIWGSSVWDSEVGSQPSLGEWHHVVLVQDNGVYRSYLDGVRYVDGYSAFARRLVASGCAITIGQGIHSGEFMDGGGMIDEVIVYPRALTADEVKELYEGTQVSASFDAMVAAGATWDLDGTAPTVKSLSGDGSVVNGTLAVTDAIAVGEGHSLSVAKLAIPGAGGALDLGLGDERRVAPGSAVEVMSVGEIDAESLANLRRWTVTGAGALREGRRVVLALEDGALKATVLGRGMMVVVR